MKNETGVQSGRMGLQNGMKEWNGRMETIQTNQVRNQSVVSKGIKITICVIFIQK